MDARYEPVELITPIIRGSTDPFLVLSSPCFHPFPFASSSPTIYHYITPCHESSQYLILPILHTKTDPPFRQRQIVHSYVCCAATDISDRICDPPTVDSHGDRYRHKSLDISKLSQDTRRSRLSQITQEGNALTS